MPMLPFGEYRPDVSDLNQAYSSVITNALPRTDGYGPVKSIEVFTAVLPGPCRGYFFAHNRDGSVAIFAGTATKLYRLDNTTFLWLDVSVGAGTYTSVDTNRNWKFAQFNDFVFATQRNAVLQKYDLTSSSAFAVNPGSPPQAGNIAVVNRFIVLCDLLTNPYRIQWSGLNDTTNWTSGTNYSDFQDLPSGGIPKAVVGGELGVILQDTEIRRMVYAPGSDVVFTIDRIHEKVGILSADAVATADNKIYLLSTKGFLMITPQGAMTPIGEEKVNRTFAALADTAATQYIQAAADPSSGVVVWTYRNANSTLAQFDGMFAYSYYLDRWAPATIAGEAVSTLAKPGLTLESLDALAPGALMVTGAANNGSGLIRITVASTATLATGNVKTLSAVGGVPNANGTWTITVISGTAFDLQSSTFAGVYTSGGVVGGSIDLLPFSLDDISTATLPALSFFDTTHAAGFLNGPALEATLETSEQQLAKGRRINVNGLRPVTDAATVYCALVGRDALQGTATTGTESLVEIGRAHV